MPIPKQKESISRTTAKERVYNTLQQWIIDGTLLPEERLNDTELAQYFSVSRTPVREALQMLAEQKLVKVVPSSGTYVAPIDQQDMIHVYQLLEQLQTIAVEMIIQKLSPADFAHLSALNESFLKAARKGSASDTIKADFDFHHYLAQCSGNSYLVSFSDNLIAKACRNENQFFKGGYDVQESYHAHGRIIEALKNQDLNAARKEVQDNWQISLPARGPGPALISAR